MSINNINALNTYQMASGKTTSGVKKEVTLDYKEVTTTIPSDEESVVLERSELIRSLQNDAEARAKQLQDMVISSLRTQAGISVGSDDVWKFLASGNYTVTAETKANAQELISEDGYYGVEQTSNRIVEFAKALSGGDVSKTDELLDAFKKGFSQATAAWGKELPDICQKTYEAVEEKFDAWKNGVEGVASTK